MFDAVFDYSNPSYANTRLFVREGVPVWAHWTYDSKEHQRFAQRDWERVRRIIYTTFLAVCGISMLPILVGLTLLLATQKGSLIGSMLLAGAGIIILVVGTNQLSIYSSAQSLYKARQHGPHEVTITPIEVNEAAFGVALVAPNRILIRVFIHSHDPSVLRLRVEDTRGGIKTTSWRPVPAGEMWVLIPKGREKEAIELADRFQREVVRTQG